MFRVLMLLPLFALAPRAEALCVQTFNAYGAFYAGATAARTARIATELQARGCDVVQLQETFPTSAVDMPATFARGLAETHAVAAAPESHNGLVALVKGEIRETTFFQFFEQTLIGIRKGFTVTRARLPGMNEEVYLVNLHLHHSSSPARLAQLLEMIDWRLSHPSLTMILTGDFNADPGSLERRFVTTLLRLRDSVEEARGAYPAGWCTYCKDNPRSWDGFPFGGTDHVYDYIYVSTGTATALDFAARAVEVNLQGAPGFTLSDHYGVTAELAPVARVPATAEEVEARRTAALGALDAVEAALLQVRNSRLAGVRETIAGYRSQLDNREGIAYAYLSR